MEIKEMTIEDIEIRLSEIKGELEKEDADLDALEAETRALTEQKKVLRAEIEQRKADAAAVAAGAGKPIEKHEERKKMTLAEVRKSDAYIEAFANYIKTQDDSECRALLTTDAANGQIPAPILVEDIVKTAWEREQILSRVNKTFFRGNLKVRFELSADGAYVHNEGTSAPTEEALTFGVVTMIPKNIKKWITISDEAVTMGGEAFLRYVYDELTYQIVKKLSALVVGDIAGLSTTAGSTAVAGAKITEAPGLTTIANAFANLSDEAENPVIIMNKLTYADFVAAQAAGNFAFDPFRGLPVLYSSALPAYGSASANAVYAIVGDLKGAQVNYPEGEGVIIKWDEISLSEEDMVKVVGRQYAAHAVTVSGVFCNIAKPAPTTT